MMTPEQKERYTKYRGSGITEAEIKDQILEPLRLHASSEATTVLRAIGKVFVGELMDRGTFQTNKQTDQHFLIAFLHSS